MNIFTVLYNASQSSKHLKVVYKQKNIEEKHYNFIVSTGPVDGLAPLCITELIPDGTKPLPEPKLTFHKWGFVALT